MQNFSSEKKRGKQLECYSADLLLYNANKRDLETNNKFIHIQHF